MDNMLYRRVFFITHPLMKFRNLCHRKDRSARKKYIPNKKTHIFVQNGHLFF